MTIEKIIRETVGGGSRSSFCGRMCCLQCMQWAMSGVFRCMWRVSQQPSSKLQQAAASSSSPAATSCHPPRPPVPGPPRLHKHPPRKAARVGSGGYSRTRILFSRQPKGQSPKANRVVAQWTLLLLGLLGNGVYPTQPVVWAAVGSRWGSYADKEHTLSLRTCDPVTALLANGK